MIIIHLVDHDNLLSQAIKLYKKGRFAHAEAFTPQGTIIGAFAIGGVQERPLDYGTEKILDEVWLALKADDDMSAKFYHYLRSPEVMGEKYAYTDIVGFLEPFKLPHWHAVFCSALIDDALRWVGWFPRPLPIAAHDVDPTTLHQMLYCQDEDRVKIITRQSPEFLAFTLEMK